MNLNMDVKDLFKNKNKKKKLPNKKTMNLYQIDKKDDPRRLYVLFALGVIIAIAAYTYFIVLDRFDQINTLNYEIVDLNADLSDLRTRVSTYDELKEEYYRYSESYISNKEQLVDRIAILTLLEETTKDLATVTSTSINNNKVNIRILTADLDKVRVLKKMLEDNTMVKNVVVYSASRSTGEVVSTVAFDCQITEEE